MIEYYLIYKQLKTKQNKMKQKKETETLILRTNLTIPKETKQNIKIESAKQGFDNVKTYLEDFLIKKHK